MPIINSLNSVTISRSQDKGHLEKVEFTVLH